MTPEDAAQMLRRNTHNRPLNQRRVDDLVHAIKTGQWKLTHQGIALSRDGVLQDGQHRLMAISRAGIPVEIQVSEVDSEIFDVIDTGRARGPRDALALAGFEWYSSLPAPIRLVEHYRSPFRDGLMGGSYNRLTNSDFIAVVEKNPLFVDFAPAANRISNSLGRIGLRSPILAAMVVIAQDAPHLADSMTEFFNKLADPVMLPEGSPVLALHRWLLATLPKVVRGRAQIGMYGIIRAWNAYAEKRSITTVQVRLERDHAPVVSGGPQ